MKIKQSKEWFLRLAELEAGCDISAGKPVFLPAGSSESDGTRQSKAEVQRRLNA